MVEPAHAAPAGAVRAQAIQAQVGRWTGVGLLGIVVAFMLSWTGYKAAGNVPLFIIVGLNGITLGGLYFVVASGFTLIFGLMRVVNLAHGSLYLLGGYIALNMQEEVGNWGVPLLVACVSVAAIGLLMQQAFLRWNQGQDLRQALITIAISIILADQMLANFGGLAKDVNWPETLDRSSPLHFYGLSYPFVRIFILLCAIAIGVGLWLWLTKTRTGMIIRAGVDDRQMVSALGINVQVMFAIAFAVGSGLAALGGVLGGSLISLGPGEDANFLLNSLIVVIIGGMGSLGGAAIGALLFGLVDSYADVYLPTEYSNYSVLLTLLLLILVLAVRPLGLFGRPA
jgi:branched-chain amino acid transport system permease protein